MLRLLMVLPLRGDPLIKYLNVVLTKVTLSQTFTIDGIPTAVLACLTSVLWYQEYKPSSF